MGLVAVVVLAFVIYLARCRRSKNVMRRSKMKLKLSEESLTVFTTPRQSVPVETLSALSLEMLQKQD